MGTNIMTGQIISHYRMLEKVGEGGMGVVYKARDLTLDRFVALKFLPEQLVHNEQEKARFIHEAKAASLLDHPSICNIHEIDEIPDGRIFIVMSYYEGSVLGERTKLAPLHPPEALDIAIQVAGGLEAAHEMEIVHCDVTSNNILVLQAGPMSSGKVKIIDFGLAKNRELAVHAKSGSTGGTVPYMSPEQARGEGVDQRTDIWSLGIVLHEMLTGTLPFKSEYREAIIYRILNEDPPEITLLIPDISVELDRIVKKCLEKEPEDRYQHMGELMVDLQEERDLLQREKAGFAL